MGHKQQRNRLRASSHLRVRMQPGQSSGLVRQVDAWHVRGRPRRTLCSMLVWSQGLERATLGLDKHCACIRLTSSQGGCAGLCRRPHERFASHSPRLMQRTCRGMSSVSGSARDCASENGFPRQDDGRVRARVFGQKGTWQLNSVTFTLEQSLTQSKAAFSLERKSSRKRCSCFRSLRSKLNAHHEL